MRIENSPNPLYEQFTNLSFGDAGTSEGFIGAGGGTSGGDGASGGDVGTSSSSGWIDSYLKHTTNSVGPNEPISELTLEQLSVEQTDHKLVRGKETQDISKGPEGESSRKKSLQKIVAQQSKKATKTDSLDSCDDLEDTISDVGGNCDDDVERNHEDDDGEDPNGIGRTTKC